MRYMCLVFLGALIALMTGCNPDGPWPWITVCNGGHGFVDEVCSGIPNENGALTVATTVEDGGVDQVCWTLAYDVEGAEDRESEWCDDVGFDQESMIFTPSAFSQGDLILTAVAYGWGMDQSLFCGDDPEEQDTWAQLHVDDPVRLYVKTGQHRNDSECAAVVELDNVIGPGAW